MANKMRAETLRKGLNSAFERLATELDEHFEEAKQGLEKARAESHADLRRVINEAYARTDETIRITSNRINWLENQIGQWQQAIDFPARQDVLSVEYSNWEVKALDTNMSGTPTFVWQFKQIDHLGKIDGGVPPPVGNVRINVHPTGVAVSWTYPEPQVRTPAGDVNFVILLSMETQVVRQQSASMMMRNVLFRDLCQLSGRMITATVRAKNLAGYSESVEARVIAK